MSTTSGVAVRYKVEETFGTPHSTTTGYARARLTGETLEPNASYTESAEIRPDGQIGAVVRTDAEGGGAINGELPYGEWDELLEACLLSRAWATEATALSSSTDVGAVVATGGVPDNIDYDGVGTSPVFVTKAFAVGMWVKIAGFTTTGVPCNDIGKVVEVTETELYITGITGFAAKASGDSVTITQLQDICNGKTLRTFTFEREDTDDTDEFHRFTGCGVQAVAIELPTSGMITTSFTLVSKIPSSPTSSVASGTDTTTTTDPMTSAQIAKFYEGDPELTNISSHTSLWDSSVFKVLGMTLNISPSLRTRKAWGTVGPALAHGRGDFDITGTVRLYYNTSSTTGRDDRVLFNKILQDTASGMALLVRDGSDNVYVFDMPRVKFTGGRRNAPAKSQDVILEMDFQAYQNPDDTNPNSGVTGTTIRIARGNHPAPAAG